MTEAEARQIVRDVVKRGAHTHATKALFDDLVREFSERGALPPDLNPPAAMAAGRLTIAVADNSPQQIIAGQISVRLWRDGLSYEEALHRITGGPTP